MFYLNLILVFCLALLLLCFFCIVQFSRYILGFSLTAEPLDSLSGTAGGLKWTYHTPATASLYFRICACLICAEPFDFLSEIAGGLKWTRTIDLALIRRAL